MAQKFILKWIRGGAHFGKFVIFQPTVNYDKTWVEITTGDQDSWADANVIFANRSYGLYPDGIEASTSFVADNYFIGNSTYESMIRPAWDNIIATTELSGGDKLVLSNGNYILVTRGRYQEGGYFYVDLEYHLRDGTIAYSGVKLECSAFGSGGSNIQLYSVPWLLSHDPSYRLHIVSIQAWGNNDKYSMRNDYRQWNPVSATLGGRFWDGLTPDDPDDPYPDDDDSDDDDGGDGTLPDDDPIDIPDVPDVSVSDSGFLTLYNPTMAQVQSLASFMWSSLFDMATFKKLFADPMECIIGLNLLPVAVPDSGATANVKIGNITTDVYMPKVTAQFVKVSCGSLNLSPIHDSYMDFAPYSKWSIYLPYIGIQSLSADDVAHKSLTVEYIVDVLTCACIAFIKAGTHVLYQFAGTCGYNIPLTSENFSRVIGNLAQLAVTVGGAVATGGASAPLNVGAVASTMNNLTANKPDVHRSGALGGSAGIMGRQKPYLIIEYPHLCKPTAQPKYLGYPSFITKQVSGVSGYTEWESIVLDGIPCTESEREEILEVMKGGCYV